MIYLVLMVIVKKYEKVMFLFINFISNKNLLIKLCFCNAFARNLKGDDKNKYIFYVLLSPGYFSLILIFISKMHKLNNIVMNLHVVSLKLNYITYDMVIVEVYCDL